MAAFTPEQIELLQAAFEHVWARMSSLNDQVNEDSERIGALALIAARKGVLSSLEELNDAIAEATIEPRLRLQQAESQSSRITEEQTTYEILCGDKDAFRRRQEEEEE